jgi:hypothetical protein
VDDQALAGVLAELVSREPLFHRTELGTSRAVFDSMTCEDFWEVGASGACYDREFVWATVRERYAGDAPDPWQTSDFRVRRLAEQVYLLTYLLRQGERVTRRATLWERGSGSWRVIYHQGTLVRAGLP